MILTWCQFKLYSEYIVYVWRKVSIILINRKGLKHDIENKCIQRRIFEQICKIMSIQKSLIKTLKTFKLRNSVQTLLFPKNIIHWMIINRNRQRGILHPLPACFALFAGSGPTQVHAIVLDTHGGHIGAAHIVHLFNSRQCGGTHLTVEVGQRGQALPKHVLSLLGTRLHAGIDTAIDVQSFSVKTIYILLASCCLLDNLHIQSKNNFCE